MQMTGDWSLMAVECLRKGQGMLYCSGCHLWMLFRAENQEGKKITCAVCISTGMEVKDALRYVGV